MDWPIPRCGTDPHSPLAAKPPQHAATAKSVIFLFMEGGPSHIDMFDPKPVLRRAGRQAAAGRASARHHADGRGRTRRCWPSSAKWKQHGAERPLGLRLAAAHRRVRRRPRRHPLLLGRRPQPLRRRLPDEHRLDPRRPAVAGSWVTYGLGTENQNLPAFVVMQDNDGQVVDGPRNWGAGFMPAVYQGTRTPERGASRSRTCNTPEGVGDARQRGKLDLLAELNREHAAARPEQTELDARIAQLRAGLPHAGRGARGGRSGATRPRRRDGSTAWTTRRPRPSAASACWPGGWSSAACASCSSITAPAASGTRTASIEQNHAEPVPADGQAGRRPAQGPQAPRPARRHAGRLGRRIRPHADVRKGRRPRPQPLRLHDVDGRRRRQGRPGRSARPTRSACTPSKTASTSTTCTPRSCT